MKKHTYINKNGVKVYSKHILIPENEMKLINKCIKRDDTNFTDLARLAIQEFLKSK
jgi:hypothetical protein